MCIKSVVKLKSGSHILPKFFLRPIRDTNGQIRTIDVIKAIVDPKSQDLPKGDFICQSCEDLTAKLDGYGAKLLNQLPELGLGVVPVSHQRVQFEHWTHISFRECRDFLLSIVIRDHCWRLSVGKPTIMDAAEYEKMRHFLMDANDPIDDNSFPIVIHKIAATPILNLHRTTSPPTVSMPKDAVTFMGLGYAIMVYFKSPVDSGMVVFAKTFGLKNDGSIKMPIANLFNIGTWKHSEHAIASSYKKLEEKLLRRKN